MRQFGLRRQPVHLGEQVQRARIKQQPRPAAASSRCSRKRASPKSSRETGPDRDRAQDRRRRKPMVAKPFARDRNPELARAVFMGRRRHPSGRRAGHHLRPGNNARRMRRLRAADLRLRPPASTKLRAPAGGIIERPCAAFPSCRGVRCQETHAVRRDGQLQLKADIRRMPQPVRPFDDDAPSPAESSRPSSSSSRGSSSLLRST